jgi:hypothetical protein
MPPTYVSVPVPLVSTAFHSILAALRRSGPLFLSERIAIVGAEQAVALDHLDEALRLAPALSPELFRKIIDRGGTRLGFGRRRIE